jgi:hypothetical protein
MSGCVLIDTTMAIGPAITNAIKLELPMSLADKPPITENI